MTTTEQVKMLREALKGVIRVADRATDEFDAARAALAATDPAAIQQAGEPLIQPWPQRLPLCPTDTEVINAMEAEINDLRAILRAPQDEKAEQRPLYTPPPRVNLSRNNHVGAGLRIAEAIAGNADMPRRPAYRDTDAPAASNVEAVSNTTASDMIKLIREADSKSAPIEAGEMPELPYMPRAAMLVGSNLESLSLRYTERQMQDYARTYGQLCRDTARPAYSVTSGADGAQSAGAWRTQAEGLTVENTRLRERLALYEQHKRADIWYWQGDEDDHLESMSNGMAVVIRADQLRALATKPASTGSVLSDAEFLSKRLSRVAKLAGVSMPDGSHEFIAGVAGTILGQIAFALDARQSVAAPDDVQGKASDAEARYEFMRTLSPRQFTDLWELNIAGKGAFDDLVDAARAQQQEKGGAA